MEQGTKRAIVENASSTLAGTACGPGTVVAVAGGATDAAAITSALATLGGGSMLLGIGTVAILAIAGFSVCRWAVRKVFKNS
jgi:hypothetical protein